MRQRRNVQGSELINMFAGFYKLRLGLGEIQLVDNSQLVFNKFFCVGNISVSEHCQHFVRKSVEISGTT
jgi:hypothetical protein